MSEETPLLKQYRSIKAAHPDAILMFRIGDFFEMLGEDAETAARELELTLTSKALGKAGRIPLAGMPYHAVEPYVARLVRRGYRVAICDQTEDPAKAKGLVRREVTRLVTPGTYEASDGRRNNFLGAFAVEEASWGIAFCDLLTGELYTAEGDSTHELTAWLARFRPSEILMADTKLEAWRPVFTRALGEVYFSEVAEWRFEASCAGEALRSHFKAASIVGFGLADGDRAANRAGIAAAVALNYFQETQKLPPCHVTSIRKLSLGETAFLDPSTLLGLEITDSPNRDREATLLRLLDDAVTAMGSRLIHRRLSAPLKDSRRIRSRLDDVEAFVSNPLLRAETREHLKRIHDLERLAARVSLASITPREAVALAGSLDVVRSLREQLTLPNQEAWRASLDDIPEAAAVIRASLVDEPPFEFGEAPVFRDGVSEGLDRLRESSRASRQWIAGLQSAERERTGIGSLKVGFNNVFGYYIEVTNAHKERIPADYIRKQTLTSAERYITEDLKFHEEIVLKANDRIAEEERRLFAELRRTLLAYLERLQRTAAVVAEIDLSAAFAAVAERSGFCRPEILDDPVPLFRIEGGRHPVVESLLEAERKFVPNDTFLDSSSRLALITGPNMAGKSTYIRQVAVIALMAQVGSFVPARSCALTPFDAIYTRIGSSDRLARGLSTFMVEMIEAAAILRGATDRSLVILDEIGRGTSTYDGLSIAWAMVESMAGRGSLALFATHYHELTRLGGTIPGVFNATVAVREFHDQIHFLHEIRPGAADRSYGIQVAAIAGVPETVTRRAKEILRSLELGELARDRPTAPEEQLTFWSSSPSEHTPDPRIVEAAARIRGSDPDELTPRQAHDLLRELKEKLA